jgi:hypothetical protein
MLVKAEMTREIAQIINSNAQPSCWVCPDPSSPIYCAASSGTLASPK